MSGDAHPLEGEGRPALRTMAEEWANYLREVLDIHVDPAGRLVKAGEGELAHGLPVPLTEPELRLLTELRRAFYAGGMAVYGIVTFGVGSDTISAEEGLTHLDGVLDELLAEARAAGLGAPPA